MSLSGIRTIRGRKRFLLMTPKRLKDKEYKEQRLLREKKPPSVDA